MQLLMGAPSNSLPVTHACVATGAPGYFRIRRSFSTQRIAREHPPRVSLPVRHWATGLREGLDELRELPAAPAASGEAATTRGTV